MVDVIIIYPTTGFDKPGISIALPLSALHAVSVVAKHYKVKLIDQRIDKNWKETLKKELVNKPICVGISSMAGTQLIGGLMASEVVRRYSPHTPIVWGGVHPSLMPAQTVRSKFVDIAVIGDAEKTFFELVRALENKKDISKVKNICFERNKKIVITESRLSDTLFLPEPPYELVDVKKYFINLYQSRKTLSLLTGRGCPHRCKYCYNLAYNKRKWRSLSPEEVVKRVKKLVEFGAQSIDLVDDNFFVDKKRVEIFCDIIEKENVRVKFMSNCRIDYISRFEIKFLKRLKRLGFHEMFVGVESGSNKILKSIYKDITIEQILVGNRKLKQTGINAIYSFMAGFPGESLDDVKKTINLMLKLYKENPNSSLTSLKVYTPFPGTELFNECIELGFKPPKSLEEWGNFNYNTPQFKISKKMNKLLHQLSYFTYFLDTKSMRQHVAANNTLLSALIKIYSTIVRLRCKYHFYAFFPEIFILEFLHKKWFSNI